MSIAPMLARSLYFFTGLSGKPVSVLHVLEGNWLELNLGAHRLQADVLHAGSETCINSTNDSGGWVDPGDTRQVQWIFPSPERKGCRRTHPGNVLELDLLKLL